MPPSRETRPISAPTTPPPPSIRNPPTSNRSCELRPQVTPSSQVIRLITGPSNDMIDNTKLPISPNRLPAVWPFSLNQTEMPSSVSCSFGPIVRSACANIASTEPLNSRMVPISWWARSPAASMVLFLSLVHIFDRLAAVGGESQR